MTEIPISPEIWKLAGEILTEKQLRVLTLRERHGYSWNQLAITLDTTRATVREHHRAASRKILNELKLRQREAAFSGVSTIEEKNQLDRIWAETRPTSEKEIA